MSRLLLLSAAFVLALAPAARAADEPKDIVAKAIKAHGGEELLTKNKAGQLRSKGKITLPGAGEVEYTQELSFMLPDKFKDVLEITVGGKALPVLTLINGDKMTLEIDGKAIDPPDGAKNAMKAVGHVMEASRLVTLADKSYELSLIGDDKVDGKKVVGVRVAKKGQGDVALYFDKETYLLAKVAFRNVDPMSGNEIAEERIPSDYQKNKDGVPVPKKIVITRDGKTFLEAEVLDAKYLEKLDDSEFKK